MQSAGYCAGDIGLEIAPGNEIEDLSLIEDVGNIWNHVPVAREWTPLDPKCAPDTCCATSGKQMLLFLLSRTSVGSSALSCAH